MDVPSTAKGVVEKVHVAKGGKVSPGSRGRDRQGSCAAAAAAPPASRAAAAPDKPARGAATRRAAGRAAGAAPAARGGLPPIDEASFGAAHASPSVRKFARELGVNLGSVRGSGEKGRILLDDVKAFVKLVMSGGVALAAPAPALPKAHNYDSGRIRRGRGQAAQSRAEDLRPAPAGRVDQHSACHAVRRVRHHRSRSAARLAQGKGRGRRREGHAAGVHHPGRGARDARIPGAQQPAG